MLISAYLLKWNTKQTFYVFLSLSICVLFHTWILKVALKSLQKITSALLAEEAEETDIIDGYKYVLLWEPRFLARELLDYSFENCSVCNCKFTKNRDLFGGDTTVFDAIIFEDAIREEEDIPPKRISSQLYVFTTKESAYDFPACKLLNENFFNWTFTYRLDSDIVWPYIVVRTLNGTKVAPSTRKIDWKWGKDLTNPEIKTILRGKKKAAAWLVSHCEAESLRDSYATRLQEHLFHYGLKIDVFGKCSKTQCPNDDCDTAIKNDYYFYLAFENSFSNDYVTDEVLIGYRNYAVPIVYGGANYTRFLPRGSFITARGMHPYNLAYRIYQAMNAPAVYEKYFRWTNLYTIQPTTVLDSSHPICQFCEMLYSEKVFYAEPKQNFRRWWNGYDGMKWCLSANFWNQTTKNYLDLRYILSL